MARFQSLFSAMFTLAVLSVSNAEADRIAPPPISARVGQAELVIVGKTTKLETKKVLLPPYPGAKNKTQFVVGVVQIKEQLKGKVKLTHVRVAFFPPPANTPKGGYYLQRHLTLGEECCLFLQQDPKQNLYVLRQYFSVLTPGKNKKLYEQQVKQVKDTMRVLNDPDKALGSKVKADRLSAASILLLHYRSYPQSRPTGSTVVQEPISAERSKLLLTALAEMDWTKPRADYQTTPLALFYSLGVTKADGWTPPTDFRKRPTAAQEWIRKHKSSFRIKRWALKKTGS